MSKRTDKLPANQLQTRLAAIQEQLTALKATQFAGSQNILLGRSVTGNNPDFVVTATYNVIKQWKVTFTPESNTFENTGYPWHVFFDESANIPNTQQIVETDPTDPFVNYLTVMGMVSGATDVFGVVIVVYSIGTGSIAIEETL